ncbi:MAG: hypothetical protein RLZZ24_909 [Pseudomonadota bacterium]
MPTDPSTHRHARIRGWVLPSVLVMVTLVALGGLVSTRQLWLQEQMLKAETQRMRNRAWAQAALTTALQDVQAPEMSIDGQAHLRQQMGDPNATHVFYPHTLAQHDVLRARLAGAPCREGICISDNAAPTPLAAWAERSAQAQRVDASQWPDGAASAWYWVEVLVYASDEADRAAQARFFYRITAWAQGSLPGARAVLQAVWQRDAQADTGRWLSWQWLTP